LECVELLVGKARRPKCNSSDNRVVLALALHLCMSWSQTSGQGAIASVLCGHEPVLHPLALNSQIKRISFILAIFSTSSRVIINPDHTYCVLFGLHGVLTWMVMH
jgi:hypothetical protein